ncbi:uncharacterized protein AAES06_019493 isoform 2-T2 [Glossophaga mutica]
MSASLPSTAVCVQKVRIFPFGTLACVALFCFAFQCSMCMSREKPRNCGDETPCTEKEPDQPGCPEGAPCPGPLPASCPPGTFLSRVSPHNTSSCHRCPQGFFNPWPGQDACFPCGSEATQPEEGKDTCICPGPGRVFQPSDGQCPCLPGHQDAGEPRGCVRREHESCKDGATWNQEGLCLTKDQWNDHCAHEVCATPRDARGYDPDLGLCLCWGQHSSGTCGPLCSEGQRHVLQLSCSEGIPQISTTEDTKSQEFYLLDKPSSPRAVGHPCHLEQSQKPVPLYVVRMDGTGFLGLTRPGCELLLALGLPLRESRFLGQDAGKTREGHLTHPCSPSLNSTHLGDLSSPDPGIPNPTVCLQINDTLAFLVTREHYPEYDLGHFYNTLAEFDWGRFRALAEEAPLHNQSPFFFLQQFQQPGVYIFRLSSNRHRKMYVRTLPPGGQCFGEGPFASTTPRYLIQTGIARIPRPLKRSDWPGVLGEIVLLLGLCLLLLIQCHSLSWARKATPQPTFRKHQQGYNLHAYTSPRTGMTSARRGGSHQDSETPRAEGGHGWEAEDQVDLEWFDTETFYEILLRQSLSVTTKLSQTKEELKLLCLKLVNEARSLRQLWSATRGTPVSTDQPLGSPEKKHQQAAEAAARAAEEEARRRRHLAGEYAASLSHQLKLLRQDLRARQEQWASFCSALLAAQRLLKAQTDSWLAKSSQAEQNPEREISQLDAVLSHLSWALLQEGHRMKAWGVLGTGTGAELLQPASASPEEGVDDISVNPITKLKVPGPKCSMLPASGHRGSIPSGYFIHPDTGRVLPEAGNLGYDLQAATLVPTTDFSSGGIRTSEAPILPYVPYPTCPATGSPPATCLPVLQPRRTSQLGAVMTDPITGIEVPVLAVTLHPQTRQWLTLGGTYCNPLTKTLAPLELGGPMEDPVTGGITPILGVGLDEITGQVLALGGLRDASGNLMLPGDNFVEPLSRKTVRLQGASLQEGQTVPHVGGSQALLDANVLVAQRQVIAVLQQCQQRPVSRAQGLLEAAIKDMRQALALSLHHVLQQARRLERQLETAHGIEASGGKIGMMCYPGTELWVPVLYGMEIPDPEGSGLMVPILGMECDRNATDATPLAGSMEDATGKVVVVLASHRSRSNLDWGSSHRPLDWGTWSCHWSSQRSLYPSGGAHRPGAGGPASGSERPRPAGHPGEGAEIPGAVLAPPGAGRDAASRTLGGPERGAPFHSRQRCQTAVDREEWEQEAQVALGVWKVLQSLRQAAEKLRQAVGHLQGQEKEIWLQQSPQVWNRHRKVVQHLSDEFQAVVRERQSFLDRALSQLQYQRELSRLQLLHTQIVASGAPVCLENYPGNRFYGSVTTSLREQAAACSLLIPFLKRLTAAIVGAEGHGFRLEDQGPGADADKGDIMLTLPLFSILKKLDIQPQAYREGAELQGQVHHKLAPKVPLQDLPKSQIMEKEELITVQPMDLSAREFVVYQYGLSILHLLIPQLHTPEVTLQIASCLPAMETSDNAFQGSFFYQSDENILFVKRECLASVGSFILLLIHCLAHITAEDFHQDSNPAFLRSFYKGLKAYFREAFSITLQMSAISWDSELDQSISAILLGEQPISEKERDLLSKLIERKHESHLEPESSEEYIKKNKDLLLFTNMEHFLKSILAVEQQTPRKPRDQFGGKDKI